MPNTESWEMETFIRLEILRKLRPRALQSKLPIPILFYNESDGGGITARKKHLWIFVLFLVPCYRIMICYCAFLVGAPLSVSTLSRDFITIFIACNFHCDMRSIDFIPSMLETCRLENNFWNNFFYFPSLVLCLTQFSQLFVSI